MSESENAKSQTAADPIILKQIVIWICEPCLNGEGKECHTPGCALWLHRVDLPIRLARPNAAIVAIGMIWTNCTIEQRTRFNAFEMEIALSGER